MMSSVRVCVIGSGAAGIAALRALSDLVDQGTIELVAYERDLQLGGVWRQRQGGPMYNNLRTNLPKEIMRYPDEPFPETIEVSYIHHSHVLTYLENYAIKYNLRRFMKFGHSVELVDPLDENDPLTFWSVTVLNQSTQEKETSIFDYVLVCNGHYDMAYMPTIEGLASFQGRWSHSVNYRCPDDLEGLDVVVLGAAASGIDIAFEMTTVASQVILSHNKKVYSWKEQPSNLHQRPGISHISGPYEVTFKDGTTQHADMILLATGYIPAMPFLSSRCGLTMDPVLRTLEPLYLHMFNASCPRLIIFDFPNKIIPFVVVYLQAQVVRRLLLSGEKDILPPVEQMRKTVAKQHADLTLEGVPPHNWHTLEEKQFSYWLELSTLARCDPIPFYYEAIYMHNKSLRFGNCFATFRNLKYRIIDDNNYETID